MERIFLNLKLKYILLNYYRANYIENRNVLGYWYFSLCGSVERIASKIYPDLEASSDLKYDLKKHSIHMIRFLKN